MLNIRTYRGFEICSDEHECWIRDAGTGRSFGDCKDEADARNAIDTLTEKQDEQA